MSPRRWVLLSPLIVLLLGNATARLTGHLWGVWSWIPIILVYWITLAAILGVAGGWRNYVQRWLQPSSGLWIWRIFAFATCALFVPVFRLNVRALNEGWIIASLRDRWILPPGREDRRLLGVEQPDHRHNGDRCESARQTVSPGTLAGRMQHNRDKVPFLLMTRLVHARTFGWGLAVLAACGGTGVHRSARREVFPPSAQVSEYL
jgi:hypothetical protein